MIATKPMLPTLVEHPPTKGQWHYEVKYDGFRGIMIWLSDQKCLLSRNGKDLLALFPEIKSFFEKYLTEESVILDGEIVALENDYKSSFSYVQQRGRMTSRNNILQAAHRRPCEYVVFDLLRLNEMNVTSTTYNERKEQLKQWFYSFRFPPHSTLRLAKSSDSFQSIWKNVQRYEGEGIVAKKKGSSWIEGKRSIDWQKLKNRKTAICFITGWNRKNGFYEVSVWEQNKIRKIGSFSAGLSSSNKHILNEIIRTNGKEISNDYFSLPPSICIEVFYLQWYKKELREPRFSRFLLQENHHNCTLLQFYIDEASFPNTTKITHKEKVLWKEPLLYKGEYLRYLRKINQHMIPFLKNRALTVVRYPEGIDGEAFFQKNCPSYAPSFIKTIDIHSTSFIICNDLRTLLWLGNQLAIEFHIPFSTMNSHIVSEIVFDLDPPSQADFPLAIKAATIIKRVLDSLHLHAYVKTSGNKGLQIFIPLAPKFTWKETNQFNAFVAQYLIEQDPRSFTTERFKAKRGRRLYVDYVQHGEGKTIIAPYSMRGNKEALVSTPIFWEELKEQLTPKTFTYDSVLSRLESLGCPFSDYEQKRNDQSFYKVIQFLKKQNNTKL
ncbi:DNA ligase D [Bacillus spongiae]|uniref:DNA ligase (ATP) n=1 Tax=Bacillus spongiae TaxID=2683610 RepID=A0ABU8HHQ3_9BACI